MIKKMFFVFFILCFCPLSSGEFNRVHNGSTEYAFVEKTFTTILQPLYGDQTKSLKKIAEEKDRACELFCEESSPLGILVYKTDLVQDYALLGMRDCFEIKTLFVIDAAKNSGKGVGSRLIERVEMAAKAISAKNVVVTVSELKQESLQFFLKKGFKVVQTYHGKYVPDVDEYLLAKSLLG